MSYSESLTQSYTTADIGKVIDCLATKLLTRDQARAYAADVKAMAQSGYLQEANIVLYDSTREPIRAAKYEVSTDGSLLKMQRPGNNLWPQTAGGELAVVVQYSQKWFGLTDTQRATFRQTLSPGWGASNTDLSFPKLTRSTDRSYVSNGWGVTKSIYQ
jgi:Bacterial HORMA domain family 1